MIKFQGRGPIKVQGPVTFTMDDNGGAHVVMSLAVGNMPPADEDLTYKPPTDVPMLLQQGKYKCAVMLNVFSYGALNTAYDSTLEVNGQLVASAKGHVATGDPDWGGYKFDLEVV